MQEQRIRKKSYPTSVLQMYIKIYCKKKKNVMEAMKSWVTLDKNERELFINKYKECQLNHKKKIANFLSKTEPFLKKKDSHRLKQNVILKEASKEMEIDHEQVDNIETINTNQLSGTDNSLPTLNNSSPLPSDMDAFEKSHCDTNDFSKSPIRNNSDSNAEQPLNEEINTSQPPLDGILAEPTPPSVMFAKDLYVMIKSNNGESTETWNLLSSTQKTRYQKAVSILKDDYITKFKAYLESLPSKQLFNYYNDFFN